MKYVAKSANVLLRCAVIATSSAILALAGFGTVSGATPRLGLPSVALRVSDLPRGATLATARFWSNAQAAKRDGVSASVYKRHGRIRSYQVTFDRELVNGLPPRGIVHADSEITAFRSAGGARWYFSRVDRRLRRQGVIGSLTGGANGSPGSASHAFTYHPAALPRIGDQTAGFVAQSSGDEFAYTTRAILFREKRDIVLLRVVGFQGQMPWQAALHIARHLAIRMTSFSRA